VLFILVRHMHSFFGMYSGIWIRTLVGYCYFWNIGISEMISYTERTRLNLLHISHLQIAQIATFK